MNEFFSRCVESIALAGTEGLSVSAAASAGAPPAPRRATLKWLYRELKAQGPLFVFRSEDDSESDPGSVVVVASSACRTRALGHSTLEHALLTKNASNLLAIIGAARSDGELQADIPRWTRLSFQTSHHYLLALLANDLVSRRRAMYMRQSLNSNSTSAETTVEKDASSTPGSMTSSLLRLTRYSLPLAEDSHISHPPEPSTDLKQSEDGKIPVRSLGRANRSGSEGVVRLYDPDRVFSLCQKIVRELRRRPLRTASQYDLKDLLLTNYEQLPVRQRKKHRVAWAIARKKLVRASIITVEERMCIDDSGVSHGMQPCFRLLSSRAVSSSRLASDLSKEAPVADIDTSGSPAKLDEDMEDDCFEEQSLDEADPVVENPLRPGPTSIISASAAGPSFFLLPHPDLLQSAYSILDESDVDGISMNDLRDAFAPLLGYRQACQLLKRLVSDVSEPVVRSVKYFGRVRRITHTLRARLTSNEAQPAVAGTSDLFRTPLLGDAPWTHRIDGSSLANLPPLDNVLEIGNRHINDLVNYMPRSRGVLRPLHLPRVSVLGLERARLVERLLLTYRIIRMDRIGRCIGAFEGKGDFNVDKRVYFRIIETLVGDGRVKQFRVEVPQADASKTEELRANVPRGLSSVEYVAHPGFDDLADNVHEMAMVADKQLTLDLLDRVVRGQEKAQKALHPRSSQEKSKENNRQLACFVSVNRTQGSRKNKVGKHPGSRLHAFKLRKNILTAINYGWYKGMMLRARLLHFSVVECVTGNKPFSETLVGGALGTVREVEVAHRMTIRTFARVVGIFHDYGEFDSWHWKESVGRLPHDTREELLTNEQGIEQRSLLLSLLSRLGLLQHSMDDVWSVCSTGVLRDFGGGLPRGIDEHVVTFENFQSVTRFWDTLELFHTVSPTTIPNLDDRTCKTSGSEALDCSCLGSSGVRPQVVLEVYDRFRWALNQPISLTLDEKVAVERALQRSMTLSSAALAARVRSVTSPKFAPLSVGIFDGMLMKTSHLVRKFVSFEKVATYLQERVAGEASSTIQSLVGTCALLKPGSHSGRKRKANPSKSSRPRRTGKVNTGARLLAIVAQLRAVVEAQEFIKVRPAQAELSWHLRGMVGNESDSEIWSLWNDVSSVMAMSVEDCMSLFTSLCTYPSIRSVFQTVVVELRKFRGYKSEAEDSSGRTLSEKRHLDCRTFSTMDTDCLDDVRETRCHSEAFVSQFRSAIRACWSVGQRRKRRKCTSLVRSGGVLQGETRDRGLRGLKKRKRGGHHDPTEPVAKSARISSESDCRVRPDCWGVFVKSVLEEIVPPANPSAFPGGILSETAQPHVVGELLRVLLREPGYLIGASLNECLALLGRFPESDVKAARDFMVERGFFVQRDSPDSGGRLYSISLREQGLRQVANQFVGVGPASGAIESDLVHAVVAGKGLEGVGSNSVSRNELSALLHFLFFPRTTSGPSLELLPRSTCLLPGSSDSIAMDRELEEMAVLTATAVPYCTKVCSHNNSPRKVCISCVSLASAGDTIAKKLSSLALMSRLSANANACCVSTAILARLIGNAGAGGVEACDVLTQKEVDGLPSDYVLHSIGFLLSYGLIARLCHGGRSISGRTVGGVVYVRFDKAVSLYGLGPLGNHASHIGVRRPMTMWSRLDGSFDNDLCREAQAAILGFLARRPGVEERKIRLLVESMGLPGQAAVDILFALRCRGIVRRTLAARGPRRAALFSRPGLSFAATKAYRIDFVDRNEILGQRNPPSIHYRLTGRLLPHLLSAPDLIKACEHCLTASPPF